MEVGGFLIQMYWLKVYGNIQEALSSGSLHDSSTQKRAQGRWVYLGIRIEIIKALGMDKIARNSIDDDLKRLLSPGLCGCWLSTVPCTKGSPVQFPVRAHIYPGFRSNPRSGCVQAGNQRIFLSHIEVSFSLSLSLPVFLKSIKTYVKETD